MNLSVTCLQSQLLLLAASTEYAAPWRQSGVVYRDASGQFASAPAEVTRFQQHALLNNAKQRLYSSISRMPKQQQQATRNFLISSRGKDFKRSVHAALGDYSPKAASAFDSATDRLEDALENGRGGLELHEMLRQQEIEGDEAFQETLGRTMAALAAIAAAKYGDKTSKDRYDSIVRKLKKALVFLKENKVEQGRDRIERLLDLG